MATPPKPGPSPFAKKSPKGAKPAGDKKLPPWLKPKGPAMKGGGKVKC